MAKGTPRDLNIQSFAQSRSRELESLHALVATRSDHQYLIPRSKRRRTTSFDNRVAKKMRRRRTKTSIVDAKEKGNREDDHIEEEAAKKEKKPCRRARRRVELHENLDSGFSSSADGTRRLRTHLWHAKRFTMIKKWGFFLPLGLHGKGRGSRALLKWLKTRTVVHDSSYCCPIELQGPQDILLAVTKKVLFPSPMDLPEKESRSIICGTRCGSALLYHIGAPNSQFVVPVTYMWRPFSGCGHDSEMEISQVSDVCVINEGSKEKNIPSRQLWIWLHAAAFEEGFDVLRSACVDQKNDSSSTISCISLEGQLAKFEIMGHKANESLQKMLHPSRKPTCGLDPVHTTSNFSYSRSFILENVKYLPPHAILSLEVWDPRDLPRDRMKYASKCQSDIDTKEEDSNKFQFAVDGDSNLVREAIQSSWLQPEHGGTALADSKDLWAFRDKISPPRKEDILCLERHNRRLMHFNMNKDIGTSGLATEEGTDNSCPMLLTRHKDLKIGTWWSVIIPIKWAKTFWIPFVSSGIHAIGLRERRWIASDNGLPSYPFDFPDCKAYSATMHSEAAAFDKAAELQPPSVRLSRIPIPPPWDCLRSSIQMENQIWEDNQTCNNHSDPHFGLDGGVGDLYSRYCHSSFPPGQDCQFSRFFVLRSSSIFHCLMNCNISAPLDPGNMERFMLRECTEKMDFNCISKMDAPIPGNGKLCLLRVLLYPYKEGSFEEGAVVCAPIFDDISIWTSRSLERTKLQIPQVQSYFIERKPGQWELQVPETPLYRSFRWPIGFVTTGFVHGSSSHVAEAFCETTLLAKLRRQQNNKMQKSQSEIFVLVRNLRSTAYRLALATIVIENQKEDLDFM